MLVTSKGEKLEIGDMVVIDGVLKGEIVSAQGRHFTIKDASGELHIIEPWWVVSKWVPCSCKDHSNAAGAVE